MAKQVSSRIVLIVSSFPKLSETFIVSKFTGLLDRGLDVHVVCGRSEKRDWAAFPELGENRGFRKRVHTTWPTSPKWLALFLLPFGLLRGLVREPKATLRYLSQGYKKFGIGVLKHYYLDQELIIVKPKIVHFEFGALAVKKTYLKSLLNVKISVSFRGYDLNYVGLNIHGFYNEVWRNVDRFHFLGNDLLLRAQKRGFPKQLPHTLISPAVDLRDFPSVVKNSDLQVGSSIRPVRILSVGRLEWKKGYDYALLAIKMLIDRGIRCEYKIVGEGSFRQSINFSIIDLGLQDVVELCGAFDHKQTIDKLYWADIFLHPALSEGFCNAVLEAQAAGVPVVCSDAGGLRENVANGVSGFVVERRNATAIAEKLEFLSKDKSLRNKMGAAGRDRVEKYFQLKDQIDAWVSFFNGLSS